MKSLIVSPSNWQCRFDECPPGLFIYNDNLFIKTQYGDSSYIANNGDSFSGGCSTKEERNALMVWPCEARWSDAD